MELKMAAPDNAEATPCTPCGSEWLLRKVSQVGMVCYILLTCALLIVSPNEFPLRLPVGAAWAFGAFSVLMIVPTWRFLGRCRPGMNIVSCVMVMAGMTGLGHPARALSPSSLVQEADPEIDALLAEPAEPGNSATDELNRVVEELRRSGKKNAIGALQMCRFEFTMQRTKAALSGQAVSESAKKVFESGWLTAEPLTFDRIMSLRAAADEWGAWTQRVSSVDERERHALLRLGLTPQQADRLVASSAAPFRSLRAVSLWHERMRELLVFLATNIDGVRIGRSHRVEMLRHDLEPELQRLLARLDRVAEAVRKMRGRGEKQKDDIPLYPPHGGLSH